MYHSVTTENNSDRQNCTLLSVWSPSWTFSRLGDPALPVIAARHSTSDVLPHPTGPSSKTPEPAATARARECRLCHVDFTMTSNGWQITFGPIGNTIPQTAAWLPLKSCSVKHALSKHSLEESLLFWLPIAMHVSFRFESTSQVSAFLMPIKKLCFSCGVNSLSISTEILFSSICVTIATTCTAYHLISTLLCCTSWKRDPHLQISIKVSVLKLNRLYAVFTANSLDTVLSFGFATIQLKNEGNFWKWLTTKSITCGHFGSKRLRL